MIISQEVPEVIVLKSTGVGSERFEFMRIACCATQEFSVSDFGAVAFVIHRASEIGVEVDVCNHPVAARTVGISSIGQVGDLGVDRGSAVVESCIDRAGDGDLMGIACKSAPR